MTTEEQLFVAEREAMLDEVLAVVSSHPGQPLYQNDIVTALQSQFTEEMVVSAIWRLLDMHLLDLNNRLALIMPSGS